MALWRVEEAADYLGIRPKTLYEWVRTGRVPHRKLGFNVRFDPEELSDWVESQSAGADPDAPADETTIVQEAAETEPEELEELREAALEASRRLRKVESDLGAQLSFPQREELRELAERVQRAVAAVDE